MNTVLKPYLRRFVLVFFVDIMVYSASWNDHLSHLRKVLSILREHQLFLNGSKCEFGSSLSYLGHIINREGVSADPEKLHAIESWPTPKNIKQLRGFLSLTGYYRRFIQSYGQIARPRTNLLKKGSYN